MKLIKKIPNITKEEIYNINKLTREFICNELKNKLLYLEKYSTTKDGNKKTYVMIPFNHPKYEFPYNLEDRIKAKINKINKIVGRKIDISVKKQDKIYNLKFNNEKFMENNKKELEQIGCKLEGKEWLLILS